MDDVREATEALLADKPETEAVLRELVAVDEAGPWTFEDVPADSGTFGEIVARGIATDHDGGYRLADRAAVRGALEGESAAGDPEATAPQTSGKTAWRPSLDALPAVSRRAALALGGLLAVLVLARVVFAVPGVFRGGDVVLAGNDPWFYRFWVEELLRGDPTAFTPGGLADLPDDVATHDVLLVVGLWWITALLGGGAWTAGLVVALYPVVAAVLTGVVLYVLLFRLTADRRIALAGVAMLALTPAHAVRTMVGFGDHHALDFLLLAVTALALVVAAQTWRPDPATDWQTALRRFPRSRARRWAVLGVGFGVAAQTLAWRGAPLVLLPLGAYAALVVLSGIRTDRPVFLSSLPLLAGLGLAGALTLFAHLAFGWLGTIRATLPLILAAGLVGVAAVAAGARQTEVSTPIALGSTVVAGLGAFGLAWLVLPGFAALWRAFGSYVARTGARDIAETQSIAAAGSGSVFGPVLLFGFVLALALAVAAYYTWRAVEDHRPEWLVLVVYTWYFTGLALFQQRFAGELSVFAAALAGVGFVHLAAAVDLTSAPALFAPKDDASRAPGRQSNGASSGAGPDLPFPDGRTLLSALVLLALVVNIGFVQTPIKQGQLAADDRTSETASWIADYDEGRQAAFPENYVFSVWGQNRLYNYVVSGNADSYSFAREHFDDFARSQSPDGWYQRLRHRPGYLVLYPGIGEVPTESMQSRLFDRFGSQGEGVPGLGHYRAIMIEEDVRVFDVVPGATIVGAGPTRERLSTTVEPTVGERSITYERTLQTRPDGTYALTVPYPGEYAIGNRTWTVDEPQIQSEATEDRLLVDESVYVDGEHGELGRWQFDLPTAPIAFDRLGRNHGDVRGAVFNESGQRPSLELDGENDHVRLPAPDHESEAMTVSMWFRTGDSFDAEGEHSVTRLLSTSGPGRMDEVTDGYQLAVVNGGLVGAVGNGSAGGVARARSVTDGNWRHAALRYNGTHVTIYFEGRPLDTVRYDGGRASIEEVVLGATLEDSQHFAGEIDDVRIYDRALFDRQVRSVYLDGRHEG